MAITREAPADVLIDRVDDGWSGLWSLLFAAGRAALTLSSSVPLSQGVALSYAAMDLREARDELE
jgi:hypothetical protein